MITVSVVFILMQLCSGCSSPRMNKWPYQVFPIDDSRTAYIYYTSESDYCWRRTLVMDENGKRCKLNLDNLSEIGDIFSFQQDTIFLMLHTFHNRFTGDTTIVKYCGTLHGIRDYTVMQSVHYHLDGSTVHTPYNGEMTKDYRYLVDRITTNKDNKAVLWYKMNAVAIVDIAQLHYNDRDGRKEFHQCIIDTTPGHQSIYRDNYGVLSRWVTFKPTSDSVMENYFNELMINNK